MDLKDVSAMLELIRVAYPKYAINLTDSERSVQVMLWQKQFADDDPRIVREALEEHIRTNEFPPSIAEIRRGITALTEESAEELWVTLTTAARRATRTEYVPTGDGRSRKVYLKDEEFKKLPNVLKRYAVTPGGLRDLHYEIRDNPMMARARFDKRIDAIRAEIRTEERRNVLKISTNMLSIEGESK